MSVNKFFAVLIFCVLCLVLGSSRLRAEETIPFTNPNFHPVPTAIIVDVPYTFMDSDIAVWDQYSSDLVVKNIDIWLFRDTGYGGVTLVVNKFMQSIYVAQKMGHTVLIEIVGPAYSGHAYIACAADKVIFDPGSSLMFHSAGREVEYLHGLITYVDSTVTPSSDISF